MDFGFTDEQLLLQEVARRIAQEKIAPSAAGFDSSRLRISACSAKTG